MLYQFSGRPTFRRAVVGASFIATALGSTALSQSAQPGEIIELAPIEVTGEEADEQLADGLRDKIRESSGAADVVGNAEFEAIPNPTFSQAMQGVPGVVVQEFFGSNDQPRFQIRGSGQQQNPTERGLLILQNGMPINRADGSYVAGFGAPGMAEAIEVWRGPAAQRLGAYVLGGAINFISPTARTRPGTQLSFGGGNDGRIGAAGNTAFQGDRASAFLQFEYEESDGFRVINNDSRRTAVLGNVEFEHGAGSATQLFLSYTDLEFGVPGPLTKTELDEDPESVHAGPEIVGGVPINPGPNVPRDLPQREADQLLAGFRTTLDMGDHYLDFGISASDTDDSFRFPISAGERVTDGYDGNLSVRYAFRPNYVAQLPLLEATLLYSEGTADRDYYHNISGSRGPQFGSNELKASTLSAYLGGNIPLGGTAFLSPSVAYTYATRDNTDTWAAATRPTVAYNPANPDVRLPDGFVNTQSNSYDRSYSGWNARLAVTWNPAKDQTAWVAVSRSFEPPTHNDLLSTAGGTPNSGPGRPVPPIPNPGAAMFSTPELEAQDSNTLEIGWRGQRGDILWDVTAYHSRIRNEILSLRDVSGSPRSSFNADRTVHTGLEAGLIFNLMSNLKGRVAWTWQDFHFDDDPVRGDNQLGGTPRNYITATLAWQAAQDLVLQGNVRWVPSKTPVDNMNTLYADPYFVADVRADYRLTDRISLVAEITNLFDRDYAASTLVVDQARPDQAAFIPGAGRAFYVGTKLNF